MEIRAWSVFAASCERNQLCPHPTSVLKWIIFQLGDKLLKMLTSGMNMQISSSLVLNQGLEKDWFIEKRALSLKTEKSQCQVWVFHVALAKLKGLIWRNKHSVLQFHSGSQTAVRGNSRVETTEAEPKESD